MKEESEEPQSADAPPPLTSRLTIVSVLSMLVGVLVTVIVVGAFFHYQQDQSLRAEMLAAKTDLTQKSRMLDEMKGEIATLSRQMYALRDYSIARSSPGERKKNAPSAPPPAELAVPAADAAGATPEAPAPVAAKPKRVKVKPDGQSCELVGKSPAEQAAILKRCVGMMDSPKPASRSAR